MALRVPELVTRFHLSYRYCLICGVGCSGIFSRRCKNEWSAPFTRPDAAYPVSRIPCAKGSGSNFTRLHITITIRSPTLYPKPVWIRLFHYADLLLMTLASVGLCMAVHRTDCVRQSVGQRVYPSTKGQMQVRDFGLGILSMKVMGARQ